MSAGPGWIRMGHDIFGTKFNGSWHTFVKNLGAVTYYLVPYPKISNFDHMALGGRPMFLTPSISHTHMSNKKFSGKFKVVVGGCSISQTIHLKKVKYECKSFRK